MSPVPPARLSLATPPPAPSRLATVRHDLRTYVNNITGYCELVIQDAADAGLAGVAAPLQTLQDLCKPLIDDLNAFAWQTAAPADHASVETGLTTFAHEVLALVAALQDAALDGGEALLPDLARIRRAAVGLDALARTLVCEASSALAPEHSTAPGVADGATAATPKGTFPTAPAVTGLVLVIDDNEANRDLLSRMLGREGLEVETAAGGREGLDALRARAFDLVLLDLLMDDLDGMEVLRHIKADGERAHLPVVMLSAVDELPRVVACLEAGADDYVAKPFNGVLLRSRVRALLERKQSRDRERRHMAQIEAALASVETQKSISEQLLANILPEVVARELREKGRTEPMYFEDVTVIITDFVGFTLSTERLSAEELVDALNQYFTAFDRIVDRYGLEKLKTVGDSYMCASGLPVRNAAHPVDAVLAAHEMLGVVRDMEGKPIDWKIRIGVHTGPVIAGVVGIRKFAFDVWGDTVNLTARMESACAPNRINLSERSYARVKDFFVCEPRGRVLVKEGREIDMYFANAVTPKLLHDASTFPPPAFERRYASYFQRSLRSFPQCLMVP